MSVEITDNLIRTYDSQIRVKFQQFQSRLENFVMRDTQASEIHLVDYIASTEGETDQTVRHGPTLYTNTDHERRRVKLRYPYYADLISVRDFNEIGVRSLDGKYVTNAVAFLNRQKDKEIIDLALGTNYSGKDGTTAVTLPAAQKILHGSTGLTPAKVDQARRILEEAEAFSLPGGFSLTMDEMGIAVISPQGKETLKRETEITGKDLTSRPFMEGGIMPGYGGFLWIVSNQLPITSTTRSCVFFAPGAIQLNTAATGSTASIDRMPTLNNAVQVRVDEGFGAARIYDEGVVEVQITES